MMKRRRTKILSLLLVLAVSFTMICGSTGVAAAAAAADDEIIDL